MRDADELLVVVHDAAHERDEPVEHLLVPVVRGGEREQVAEQRCDLRLAELRRRACRARSPAARRRAPTRPRAPRRRRSRARRAPDAPGRTATAPRARRAACPASCRAITSRARKLLPTKLPRLRPMRSLRCATIAVCGIGMPSGCRNSAVTANQSASPPTIAASAVARTSRTQKGAKSGRRWTSTDTTTNSTREPREQPRRAAAHDRVLADLFGVFLYDEHRGKVRGRCQKDTAVLGTGVAPTYADARDGPDECTADRLRRYFVRYGRVSQVVGRDASPGIVCLSQYEYGSAFRVPQYFSGSPSTRPPLSSLPEPRRRSRAPRSPSSAPASTSPESRSSPGGSLRMNLSNACAHVCTPNGASGASASAGGA